MLGQCRTLGNFFLLLFFGGSGTQGSRAEANRGLGAERSPRGPFVGKSCSLARFFMI